MVWTYKYPQCGRKSNLWKIYICKKGYFSGGQQVRPMPDAVGRDKKEGNPEESPQAQNKVSDFFGYCK